MYHRQRDLQMKNPGVIYRRYRQLKRKLLYDKIVRARQVCHRNCYYGKVLSLQSDILDIRSTDFLVCRYGLEESSDELVLCTKPTECNAFANKWTREKVEAQFGIETADWKIKLEKYPELVALEWVLDKDLTDAIKSPSFLGSLVVNAIMFLEKLLKYVNRPRMFE